MVCSCPGVTREASAVGVLFRNVSRGNVEVVSFL